MRFSDTRDYQSQRRALLDLICPTVEVGRTRQGRARLARPCHWCQANMIRRPLHKIHFDHVDGKLYHTNRLNRIHRLRVLYREWVAAGARVGDGIVGACETCNLRRAGHQTAARAYTAAHRRRRNKAGLGYTAGMTAYYKALAEREPVPF